MGVDIDLYEFKGTIKRYDDKDDGWIEFPETKAVGNLDYTN